MGTTKKWTWPWPLWRIVHCFVPISCGNVFVREIFYKATCLSSPARQVRWQVVICKPCYVSVLSCRTSSMPEGIWLIMTRSPCVVVFVTIVKNDGHLMSAINDRHTNLIGQFVSWGNPPNTTYSCSTCKQREASGHSLCTTLNCTTRISSIVHP